MPDAKLSDDQSFTGNCPMCGQRFLAATIKEQEQRIAELENRLKASGNLLQTTFDTLTEYRERAWKAEERIVKLEARIEILRRWIRNEGMETDDEILADDDEAAKE